MTASYSYRRGNPTLAILEHMFLTKYRELYGDRAYAPRSYQNEIAEKIGRMARRFDIGRATGRRARRIEGEPQPPKQLRLA